jgi:hypothetical protein
LLRTYCDITTSCMGDVFLIFTHPESVRSHAWLNVRLSLDLISTNSVKKTYYEWPQFTCSTYLHWSCSRVNHACMYAFAHLWTDFLQLWWKHTAGPQKLSGLFNLYVSLNIHYKPCWRTPCDEININTGQCVVNMRQYLYLYSYVQKRTQKCYL